MHLGRTTLSKFLIQQLKGIEGASDLGALLVDVAAAVKAISAITAKGALGVAQDKPLDLLANDTLVCGCNWGGLVAGLSCRDDDAPLAVPPEYERGRYLLLFAPLDSAPNTDVNVTMGSLFSVLRHDAPHAPATQDFLHPGRQQVAAGYAIYGPATLLVLTVGKGTHGFTLDREIGNFILTHPHLAMADDSSEFAVSTSNTSPWEPPVHRYVTECQAGRGGERGRDFSMRWISSMVAEVHRTLVRGGVCMVQPERLHLLHEANPIALLIEQAGGLATTGRERILDVQPEQLHHRVPMILGSRAEVQRIERYHAEHDSGTDRPYVSPLFNERSLFRPEALV